MGRIKSNKGPDYKKKGKPSGGVADPITGLREVQVESLDQEQEIADKYTEGPEQQPASNVHIKHPNRNLNKPEIDKPPYT